MITGTATIQQHLHREWLERISAGIYAPGVLADDEPPETCSFCWFSECPDRESYLRCPCCRSGHGRRDEDA